MNRHLSALAAAALLAGTPAASAAAGGPRMHNVRPNALVLAPRDVPADYTRIVAVHFTLTDIVQQHTWTLAQLTTWGYLGGFESQFSRAPETPQQTQLSSNAGVYKTTRGASLSLAANANNCNRLRTWQELTPQPKIGDEAHLCKTATLVGDVTAITYFVVWRIERYKGSISLTAIDGVFQPSDALAFARLQALKMRRLIVPAA